MDENKKQRVRVVAALLERSDGRVLITQRRPQAFMPLKWEFPGGKVEPLETDHDALKRELREELGIEVMVGDHFMSLLHEYPDFEIDFNVYRCTLASGSLQALGVRDFRWVPISQLEAFEFPPADLPTVKLLLGQ
jgi:8-oxo-dGTP diphosphatase